MTAALRIPPAATACHRDKQGEEKILRQVPRAWHEGYQAGLLGLGRKDCTHQRHATASWSWSSGHIEGKAARLNARNVATELDERSEH
jgi:ribosome modulation factor